MIPHPQTMQAVTEQRWHEVQARTQRERLAMAAQQQAPEATHLATLRVAIAGAVRMMESILGRYLDIGKSRDAQPSAVP